MVESINLMRHSVSIPAACRERYHPIDHPALASWHSAGVVFSGVSDLVDGYRIVSPAPVSIMLIATAAGRGWAQVPGARYELTPGTLLIAGPGVPVAWAAEGSWRMAWWYLRPGPRWRGWRQSLTRIRSCPATLFADLADDLHARTGIVGQSALAQACALLLLAHFDALAGDEAREPGPVERFASLWQEIECNPADTWTLPVLAQRLGCSVSSLQRLAQRRLGQAPARALTELRLVRARGLLRQTGYPLATIAELVGYGDAFSFSTAYRRWAGWPPSAERQRGD